MVVLLLLVVVMMAGRKNDRGHRVMRRRRRWEIALDCALQNDVVDLTRAVRSEPDLNSATRRAHEQQRIGARRVVLKSVPVD